MIQHTAKLQRTVACACTLAALLLTTTTPTQAEMITFGYTGTVTSIAGSTDAVAGDPFSGWLSFDTDTPDSYDPPDRGEYRSAGQLFFQVGETSLSTPRALTIYTGFREHQHSFGIDAMLAFEPELDVIYYIAWGFKDTDAGMFESDALPSVPPPGDVIDDTHFFFEAWSHSISSCVGEIESIYLIPEPSSVLLLVGAFVLGCMKRRSVSI